VNKHLGRNLTECRVGQRAHTSGIYNVVHYDHRADHEVIVMRGEEFPACRTCGQEVRFYQVRGVCHLTHDFDFAGPSLHLLKRAS
jgi:hypothetical protein